MIKILPYSALILICLTCSTACSSKSVETTTITETTPDDGQSTATKKEVKVEKKEETSSGCSGVIGCTLEVTGDIIAFPFRLIGGLIDFIF